MICYNTPRLFLPTVNSYGGRHDIILNGLVCIIYDLLFERLLFERLLFERLLFERLLFERLLFERLLFERLLFERLLFESLRDFGNDSYYA